MDSVVHLERLAHDVGIAAVPLPEFVAQHEDRIGTDFVLSRQERPAQVGLDSQDVKKFRGDHSGLDALRLPTSEQDEGHGVVFDDRFQRLVLLSIVEDLFHRERHVVDVGQGSLLTKDDQLFAILVGERTQEDAVDDAEDGGVRSDA